MVYNYIFISSGARHLDMDGYYPICVRDLEKCENVHLVYDVVDRVSKPIRSLYEFHVSQKINNIFNIPFKNIWIPLYFKNPFDNNKPLCIVFQNWGLPPRAFRYFEKKYPGAKKVVLHRDMVEAKKEKIFLYEKYFDLSMTIDNNDAEKYGYVWFEEFESKLDDLKISENYPECDVYFAGKAKDRLSKLMTIYHKLTAAGLKVHYYLLEVPEEQQVPYEGITYGKRLISYKEMLHHSINSRCMLDVNQEGAMGYTSRFLEAVMYNKPLIADNPMIKTSKFYNPDFIQVYEDWNDLDPEFVKKDEKRVDFHYKDEFSPIHLIERIDDELVKRFGK